MKVQLEVFLQLPPAVNLIKPDFWREDTQMCIEEGVLDHESRSDICRALVTLLVAKYGPKPGRNRREPPPYFEISLHEG